MKDEAIKKSQANARAESAIVNRAARSPLHDDPFKYSRKQSALKAHNSSVEFIKYQDDDPHF